MSNQLPLHTNNDKKIVFLFSVIASTIFNLLLFSSIGENIFIRIIWGIVGIAVVFFQALKLREFYNTKKNIRWLHFSFYIICTIVSIFGTLGAGYSNLEKTKLKNITSSVEIENIDKRIKLIESKTNNTIDSAIDTALKLDGANQWATIRLIKEKKELAKNEVNNFEVLEKLKLKRAELLKKESSVISSLTGISDLFNVSQEKIAFIFLIMCAIILEMMVFGTATFNGKIFEFNKKSVVNKKIKKIEIEKNKGQIFFRKIG